MSKNLLLGIGNISLLILGRISSRKRFFQYLQISLVLFQSFRPKQMQRLTVQIGVTLKILFWRLQLT